MRFSGLKDLSPLQLDTGRVRYTRRAMQTFEKPDCKLYSFIICNSLRGDGFVGTDGNCCKNARHGCRTIPRWTIPPDNYPRTITPRTIPPPVLGRTFPPDNSPPNMLCIHTYTCMHTHTHTHTYIHTHIHIHIHTHIHIHAYIYMHTYTYIHIQAYIHIHLYVCMRVYNVCMYVCIHICIIMPKYVNIYDCI